MAEQIVSPGVFTRESDQSFITEGPIVAGAAIIGPTTKGPIEEPTLVTSYSDYVSKFGGAIESASGRYDFFTTITAYDYFQQGGDALLVTRVVAGNYTAASSTTILKDFEGVGQSFVLKTIAKGIDQNSSGSSGGQVDATNGVLPSGSADNVRWQITNVNTGSGTFNLLIRRGNDTTKEPVILEQYLNINLDPFSPNYIENVIGNQTTTVKEDDNGVAYLQITGSYPNKSRYVYVDSVTTPTPNYLNAAGNRSDEGYTASLPAATSGAFANGTGAIAAGANFYGDINNSNTQGLTGNDYTQSISLLSNKDLYLYGALTFPGLLNEHHASQISLAVANAESAGDSIVVIDPISYGTTNVTSVTAQADGRNTSYAAMYWPWVQTASPNTGQRIFVPASTFIPGVYAFNDKQRAPWFAPAGLQRGSLGGVIRAEKSLTKGDRDTLYEGRINPIATFSNSGVVVFGQKTLQKKASALDRINVRRLLINLKQFVGGVGRTLVFENNTTATRNAFLAQVNPYLESVQQRQGLYAFKVVMDASNNTPDVVDRNQLVGQVFIQPAKTAEFVIIDFNILPTGVEFPS
jgi:hypothetical protein